MARYVPEFALVTGAFLGLSALVAGIVLGWGLLSTAVVAAVASYPFVAFGLLRDDDPAAVVRPRWLLAAGALFGLAGLAGAVWDDPSVGGTLFGLLVGLALALPGVAYAVHYGAGVNPLSPRQTVAIGVAAAVLVLVAGLAVGEAAIGAADALLLALSAAVYASARGVRFAARSRRLAAAAGGLLGLAVVAVGAVRGAPLGDWIVVGMTLALAPSLYYALTAESLSGSGVRGRTRRDR
jgi:hypothetical protein